MVVVGNTIQCIHPPAMYENVSCSTFLLTLDVAGLLNVYLLSVQPHLIVVLIFISLMTNDVVQLMQYNDVVFFFFFLRERYLFIYLFWLCWVFVSVRGLSLAEASGGHSSSRCAGLSLLRPLLLRSTSSRRAGSVVVAHGPSCSAACGISPDQGSNPCPLHWQADSQPLRHQGSPM